MKLPIKIVMIEDDLSEISRFSKHFEQVENMDLVAAADGASEGLKAVMANRPDVVLLDLELREGNGLQLLHKFKELDRRPFVIVTTWTVDETTIQSVRANGSGYVQFKGMEGYAEDGPQMVEDYLKMMEPFLRREEPSLSHEAVEELLGDPEKVRKRRIAEALGRIAIPAGTIGHQYLLLAILTVIDREDGLVDLENDVYPRLEKEFHVDRGSIEIAMRRYIEKAWSKVDLETLQREYTQYVDPEKGKPNVHEFIGYYAARFR